MKPGLNALVFVVLYVLRKGVPPSLKGYGGQCRDKGSGVRKKTGPVIVCYSAVIISDFGPDTLLLIACYFGSVFDLIIYKSIF